MTDEQLTKLAPHLNSVRIEILSVDPNYVKCPRCWHFTHEGLHNHDGLCDRCVRVMIDHHKDHPEYEKIKDTFEKQKLIW